VIHWLERGSSAIAKGPRDAVTMLEVHAVSRDMAVRKISISKSDLQGHLRALALVPFDRQHTISK